MNTERFYLVTTFLHQQFTEHQISQTLQTIITGIQDHINEPARENLQLITQGLDQLKSNIEGSRLVRVPQTWMPIIETVGLRDCVGLMLHTRVKEIIAASQPLVNEAQEEITKIKQVIDNALAAIAQIHTGFEMIHIQKEALEPGTAELSVLLPRDMFDDGWDHFLKEGQLIDRLVKTASDIATSHAETAKIRQISSSDLTLFLIATPPTVLFVVKVVNMILEAYERVLKIRKAKAEAEAAEMPTKVLREFEKEANKTITNAINAFLEKVKKTELKGRTAADRNTLLSHMKDIAERIAMRIDRGMRIEGAAEPPERKETGEGEEAPAEPDEALAIFAEIEDASDKVRYLETAGEPILGLPKPTQEEQPPDENG